MKEHQEEHIKALARKLLTGTITPGEQQILEHWMNEHPGNELTWEKNDENEEQLGNRIFSRIMDNTQTRRRRSAWLAAASILLLIAAGIYFWYPAGKQPVKEIVKVVAPPQEILPGTDKAILTLADGRQVQLDGQKVITDGALQIRNENNELIYEPSSTIGRNTMSTPRGGQYQLRLPDGSRVWLNATSSITYPTAFTGNERIVELSGEAYFEVAKKTDMPFSVKMNGMSIDVLGTHFNVMGYDDEAFVKTTLLEGSVRVTKENSKALLKPGQEANANNTGEKIKVAIADVEQATAWKNGMFYMEIGRASCRERV